MASRLLRRNYGYSISLTMSILPRSVSRSLIVNRVV
nr:MAG TPA: hypothetical protein [Caudoviricetes sp.]